MLDILIEALIALNWFEANLFNMVKHAGYLQKFKLFGISGQVFTLISFFSVILIDGFKWFWMVSLHMNIH